MSLKRIGIIWLILVFIHLSLAIIEFMTVKFFDLQYGLFSPYITGLPISFIGDKLGIPVFVYGCFALLCLPRLNWLGWTLSAFFWILIYLTIRLFMWS